MARKKKVAKKSPKRRTNRRMGSIGSKQGFSNAMPLLAGLALGAVGSAASEKLLGRFNLSPKISGGIKIVAGLWLSGSNSPIVRGFGLGVASAGTITVANSFGLLQGFTAALNGIADGNYDEISGLRQDMTLNGINWQAYVNGISQNDVVDNPDFSAAYAGGGQFDMPPMG